MPGVHRWCNDPVMQELLAPNRGPRPVKVLRMLARAASVLSLALLVMFAFSGGNWPSPREWLMIAFFPVGVAVGMVLAWHREVLGGAVTLAGLAGFYVIALTADASRPLGPWFVVLASPGMALLACGLVSARAAR